MSRIHVKLLNKLSFNLKLFFIPLPQNPWFRKVRSRRDRKASSKEFKPRERPGLGMDEDSGNNVVSVWLVVCIHRIVIPLWFLCYNRLSF